MIYDTDIKFRFLKTWRNEKYKSGTTWIIKELIQNDYWKIHHYYCIKLNKSGTKELSTYNSTSLTYNTCKINFNTFLELLNTGYIAIIQNVD